MSEGFQNTAKQREIVELILKAVDAGAFIHLQDLHAQLSYGAAVSNQAVQCSVRILERRGFLVRERRAGRVYYKPTRFAYQKYRG